MCSVIRGFKDFEGFTARRSLCSGLLLCYEVSQFLELFSVFSMHVGQSVSYPDGFPGQTIDLMVIHITIFPETKRSSEIQRFGSFPDARPIHCCNA